MLKQIVIDILEIVQTMIQPFIWSEFILANNKKSTLCLRGNKYKPIEQSKFKENEKQFF